MDDTEPKSRPLVLEPIEERRFVVVGKAPATEPGKYQPKFLRGQMGTVIWDAISVLPHLALGKQIAELVAARTRKAVDAGIPVRYAESSQLHGLYFPPSHPRPNLVYVAHPLTGKRYIPMAALHRVIFEEKVVEAFEMLAYLGATKIQVSQVTGTKASTELGARLNIPTTDVGASVNRSRSSDSAVVFSASLAPKHAPRVPENLSWYHHESSWQSIARTRLETGLQDFALDISFTDNYGVSAKVSAKIEDVGLEVGGEFEDFSAVQWKMSGTFTDMPE